MQEIHDQQNVNILNKGKISNSMAMLSHTRP